MGALLLLLRPSCGRGFWTIHGNSYHMWGLKHKQYWDPIGFNQDLKHPLMMGARTRETSWEWFDWFGGAKLFSFGLIPHSFGLIQLAACSQDIMDCRDPTFGCTPRWIARSPGKNLMEDPEMLAWVTQDKSRGGMRATNQIRSNFARHMKLWASGGSIRPRGNTVFYLHV